MQMTEEALGMNEFIQPSIPNSVAVREQDVVVIFDLLQRRFKTSV